MSRIVRVVIPGMPHHITQRGVRRLAVFRDDEDRLRYLRLFAQSAHCYQLTVRAYTLMSNPVRARMVNCATDYRWSSARAHCLASADPLLTGEDRLAVPGWAAWLEAEDYDPKVDDFIRACTFSGRPCGDEAFVRDLERQTGRRLMPAKRGPKPEPWKTQNLSLNWGEDKSAEGG